MQNESDEKEFAPSEQKLSEARRKGDIAFGRELLTAASSGAILFAFWINPRASMRLLEALISFWMQPISQHTEKNLPGFPDLTPQFLMIASSVLFWLSIPAVVAVTALLAQRALIFPLEKLKPQLSRISPLSGFKRRFGVNGLVDFLRNTIKALFVILLLWIWFGAFIPEILNSSHLAPVQVISVSAALLGTFLLWILLLQSTIALFDLLWQHFAHRRRLRMTRHELTEELKNSEGDAHIKSRRRRRAEELAGSHMLADVARASVVIVNPQHYAVALEWNRHQHKSPRCLAKGVDHIALQIRAAAETAGVPIHNDPPTARSLYATVRKGDEVRPEHYRAVAAAIRYADQLKRHGSSHGKNHAP